MAAADLAPRNTHMDEHRIAVIKDEFSKSLTKITEEHFSRMRTIFSENQKQFNKLFERCFAIVDDGARDAHPHFSAPEQYENANPDDDFNCDDADVLSGLEFVEDENGLNAEIDETDVVSAEQKNSKTPVSALDLFDESPKKNGERYFVWCNNSDEQRTLLDCVHDTYKLDLEGNDLVYNSRIVSTFGAFPRVKLKFNVLYQFGLCFLAKLFSSISSIKASYVEMQLAQCPYDSETIQSADEMVVSELKILSEMKQCYFKQQVDEFSPETTQLLAELKEQKSFTKTLQIMEKNFESEYQLKQSELPFVREKLEEAIFRFSALSTSHFITIRWQTVKAIRIFVSLMISEMRSAGWALDAAVNSSVPGVVYSSDIHKSFAFESFVCQKLFDGFTYPYFSLSHESASEKKRQPRQFFERFTVMKSQKLKEYLASKPKSTFAKFCRTKYLRLVHPKMEACLFGNLNQRNLLTSGDFPETDFFLMFSEMAKKVWMLHCLAFSFEPAVSIFQVNKQCRFSEVYMECLNQEAFLSTAGTIDTDPRVAFTVVPGFKIGKTVIQSQVFLT